MKPLQSNMTAAELEAWRDCRDLTHDAAATKLGISRRAWYNYLAGQPIPMTVALLCWAFDVIEHPRKWTKCR